MTAKSNSRRRHGETSFNSLDIARDAFTWLTTGPQPVSLNGRLFAGLPDRRIPLDEVRDRLLMRDCPQETRDAVWAHLVLRARIDGATWTVAAVGVALPALTSVSARLSSRFAGDPADVHAEVLQGFLAALSSVDLRRPRIMLRLRWAAYRSGYRALSEALSGPTPVAPGFRSSPPSTPWGHPDLVLVRAVADGVLTETEAVLIGATRLECVSLSDWASANAAPLWAAYKVRKRAEARLARYLRVGAVDDDDTDALTAQVMASITLRRPAAIRRGADVQSLSVYARYGSTRKEIRAGVSKTEPESGVQGCGSHPRSARVPEVPRCA